MSEHICLSCETSVKSICDFCHHCTECSCAIYGLKHPATNQMNISFVPFSADYTVALAQKFVDAIEVDDDVSEVDLWMVTLNRGGLERLLFSLGLSADSLKKPEKVWELEGIKITIESSPFKN